MHVHQISSATQTSIEEVKRAIQRLSSTPNSRLSYYKEWHKLSDLQAGEVLDDLQKQDDNHPKGGVVCCPLISSFDDDGKNGEVELLWQFSQQLANLRSGTGDGLDCSRMAVIAEVDRHFLDLFEFLLSIAYPVAPSCEDQENILGIMNGLRCAAAQSRRAAIARIASKE